MKTSRHLRTAGLLACSLSAATATALAGNWGEPTYGPMGYGMYSYGIGPGLGYGDEFDSMPYAMFGRWDSERRGYYSYLADRLDLSTEQRTSVRDIIERARDDGRKLRDSMLDNREQMHDTLKDKGYGAQFEQMAKKQGDLIGQLIALRAKTRSQVIGVLTDNQRKELKDLRDRRYHRDYDEWY